MLASYLSDAKAEVDQEWKEIKQAPSPARAKPATAQAVAEPKIEEESDEDIDVVKELQEFLFDVFDANMMPEYHALKSFEDKSWPKFDPDIDEFSFEQQKLHDEFVLLFEAITETFVRRHGFTNEQFYEKVRRGTVSKHQSKKEEADDVLSVLHQVSDFTVWAAEMRERAGSMREWERKQAALKPAEPAPAPERGEAVDVVHLMSEYLFDLWDANCMAEYHRLQAFEDKAFPQFEPAVDEYSFAQEDLHKEFVQMVEGMTEGLLQENGVSSEDFYEKVKALMADKSEADGESKEEGTEVVEILFQVADFRVWAKEMRKLNRRFKQYGSKYGKPGFGSDSDSD
jgi:hypothetical protein